jgi:hypothetical protein
VRVCVSPSKPLCRRLEAEHGWGKHFSDSDVTDCSASTRRWALGPPPAGRGPRCWVYAMAFSGVRQPPATAGHLYQRQHPPEPSAAAQESMAARFLPPRTARLAKYAAGREGALHGLAHAIDRASKREQWTIVELLKTVARADHNPRVRRHAAGVLGPLRGV